MIAVALGVSNNDLASTAYGQTLSATSEALYLSLPLGMQYTNGQTCHRVRLFWVCVRSSNIDDIFQPLLKWKLDMTLTR